MDGITVGEYLRRLREERNLSVRAAAKQLGMSHSRLLEIERGLSRAGLPTGPSREQINDFARFYGVSKSTLLDLAGFVAKRPELDARESELLEVFRELPDAGRDLAVDLVRAVLRKVSLFER